jgi:hypothetical protein
VKGTDSTVPDAQPGGTDDVDVLHSAFSSVGVNELTRLLISHHGAAQAVATHLDVLTLDPTVACRIDGRNATTLPRISRPL